MTPAPAVMVLGCTSDAGKSFLVMALCRALSNRGFDVAPFKAQNMSNNAAVTRDGLEIGRAQYAQALAARAEPDVRMNPILLKPVADTHSHVVAMGVPAPHIAAMAWLDRPRVTWPTVEGALASLREEHEVVVIEGAGSPAEVNLRASDIVNMRVALAAGALCYLVVDIDRGGSFAHLLGTWECLEPHERALIRGFVLNKFRGDPSLLGDGPAWLESRTGVPIVAVVPWVRHALPEEDRFVVRHTGGTGAVRVGIVTYPYASNLDEFDPLGWEEGVSVELIRGRRSLDGFDAIVLPGSRNTVASVDWLRSEGLAEEVRRAAGRGAAVLGVCGGLQLLGERIDDPLGIESGGADGLGLLPLVTELMADKTVTQCEAVLLATGQPVRGYEIHHGITRTTDDSLVALLDGDRGWLRGSVSGTYVHGLFDGAPFRQWFLDRLGWQGTCGDWAAAFDAELEAVAAHVESTGWVDHVVALLPAATSAVAGAD